MIIDKINPFRFYKNNNIQNRTTQTTPTIPQLKCDTVAFAGKKKQQLIWKYEQSQVVKRLMKKGAPQESIRSILDNPKKKQALAQFVQDFEEEKIKFSRAPREREIVFAIDNEFDYEKLEKFISWQDNAKENNAVFSRPLKTKEALTAIQNNATEEQIQRALTLSDKDSKGKTYLSYPITFKEGLYAAQANYTDEQAEIYYTLKKNNIYPKNVVDNPKKYQRLIELIKNPQYTRPLSIVEAAGVVERNFTDEQIQRYINLKDNGIKDFKKFGNEEIKEPTTEQFWTIINNNLSEFQTYYFLKYDKEWGFFQIVKDENLLKKFLNLIGEFGEVQTTRPLTFSEAIHIFDSNNQLGIERVQKYIDLLDKNADKYISKSLVTKFWEYKDTTDIQKLDNKEKRELLKRIMAEAFSLFSHSFYSNEFSIIPKNQEEYCNIVSKLANSIGMDSKELSKKELSAFEDGLNSLINKIPTSNLNKNSRELKKELEGVFVGLGEVKNVLNNEKDTQKTLKVLQKITREKDFQTLSKKDQKTLAMAVLLHNLNKNSNDKISVANSAFDAFYSIQKLNLEEDDQLKIYEIIKNQNWLDNFSEKSLRQNSHVNWAFDTKTLSDEGRSDIINAEISKITQDIAFETRHDNTFKLTKLLSKAILEEENGDIEEFSSRSKEVEKCLDYIQKTQIFLPQAKFPKASNIKNGEIIKENGIKNTVLDLNKCDFNLEKYGFEAGTTKENLYMLVHGLDRVDQLSNFSTFSIIDTEALLSTSYMNPINHKVFRQQGIILDVHTNDIHVGYYKDFGSGCRKTLEAAKREYIFPNSEKSWFNRGELRSYIPNLIKQKLNLDDNQYVKLISEIQNLKSWTSIQKYNPRVASALKSVFDDMELGKRRFGREYNEVLVSRPKIQAVFSYGQEYEKIPTFLKKYAMDNDLPIILLGE